MNNPLPDPTKLGMTMGVISMQRTGEPDGDYLFAPALARVIQEQFAKEPDECLDGGNDKRFFVLHFRGTKLFAAENEVGGLTVMLPEEY